ncbi:hypothetical protein BsWGS_09291 [Bradybaena similaris]
MSSHRHLDGTASAQPSGSRSPQSTEDIHENVGHDTPDSVRGCALCHNASSKYTMKHSICHNVSSNYAMKHSICHNASSKYTMKHSICHNADSKYAMKHLICHNASRKSAPETWTSSILPRFAKEG